MNCKIEHHNLDYIRILLTSTILVSQETRWSARSEFKYLHFIQIYKKDYEKFDLLIIESFNDIDIDVSNKRINTHCYILMNNLMHNLD